MRDMFDCWGGRSCRRYLRFRLKIFQEQGILNGATLIASNREATERCVSNSA